MQCNCLPPLPSEAKICLKEGKNRGKQYFSCSQGKCRMFHWADGPTFTMKVLNGRRDFGGVLHHPAKNKPSGNGVTIKVTLALSSFDFLARKVWFSAIHSFHVQLSDYYKRISDDNKMWDDKVRIHLFDLAIYDEYISEITSDKYVDIEVTELPRFLIRGIKEFMSTLHYVDADCIALNINSSLNDRLLDYQVEGIKYVIQRSGRALIGDDMGLGKTLQALGVIQHYRNHLPALILVPVILIQQWKREIMKYCSDLFKPSDICIIRKPSDRLHKDTQICIVPYTIIEKMTSILLPGTFGIVVADESHTIKSKDAKRTIASLPYLEQASVALCLSGTPVLNRPVEAFTQLSGILPKVFNDYDSFVKRYCDAKESYFKRGVLDVSGASNIVELSLVMSKMAMIRRLKTHVLKELPDKLRETRHINYDPNYESDLKQIQKRIGELDKLCSSSSVDPGRHVKLSCEKDALFTKYYEVTGMCKLKGIQEELILLLKDARVQRRLAETEFDLHLENEKNNSKDVLEDENANITIEYNTTINEHDQSKMGTISKPECDNSTEALAQRTISMISLLETDRMAFTVPAETVDASYSDTVIHKESPVVLDDLVDSDTASVPVKMDTDPIYKPRRIVSACKRSKVAEGLNIPQVDASIDVSREKKIGKKQKVAKKSMLENFKLSDEESDFSRVCDDDIHDFIDYDEDFDSEEDRKTRKKSSKRPLKRLHKGSAQVIDDSNDEYDELKVVSKAKKAKGTKLEKENSKVCDDLEVIDWEQEEEDTERYKKAFGGIKKNITKAKNRDKKVIDLSYDNVDMEVVDFEAEQSNIKQLWGTIFNKSKASTTKAKRSKNGRSKSNNEPVEEELLELDSRHKGLGKKILVFVHHKSVMNALEIFLKEEEVGYIRIDGAVGMKARSDLVDQFQDDDVTIVALLSITACGTGLNLTRANVVLFAELFWSTGGVLQAEDRVHRIGQDGPVKIIYLLCKNTADDTIWKVIQSKHDTIDTVVGINGKVASRSGMVATKPSDRDKDKNKSQNTLTAYLEVKTSEQNGVNYATAVPSSTNSLKDAKITGPVTTQATNIPTQYEVKTIQPQNMSYYTQQLKSNASVPLSNNTLQVAEYTLPAQYMDAKSKNTNTPLVSIQNPTNVCYVPQHNNINSYSTSASSQAGVVKQSRPLSPSTLANIEEKRKKALERKSKLELQNLAIMNSAPAAHLSTCHGQSLPLTVPKNENGPISYNFTSATGKTITVATENFNSNETNTHTSFVAPVNLKRPVD